MTSNYNPFSRREFLQRTSVAAGTLLAGRTALLSGKEADVSGPRPKVAAIFTVLRFRSHAYNILENFLASYLFNGQLTDPGVDVVAFYADQFPDDDMARDVSRKFGIPLFASIDEALCLGGKHLAVDAVLSIGEHGDYPHNARGQQMYPRKRFFDESVAVMKRSGRFVPFFNDKHLSYRWDWADEMYQTARAHGIPLMAGSSVPLAERRPPLELPSGAEIEEAVAIHGGGIESYDFHGLEVLQSFVESRAGGETGIARVELLTGTDFQQAMDQGRWSQALVEAAMQAESDHAVNRQPWPIFKQAETKAAKAENKSRAKPVPEKKTIPQVDPKHSHALVLTYKDGFRGTVLKVGNDGNRWNFACRLKGESRPRATALFNGPWGNRCLFKALSHSIQHLFVERSEPYPVERTLLISGVLDAAMHSHEQGGNPIETPHLEFNYQPIDFHTQREKGKTWQIITTETKQPIDFEPGDQKFLKS